MIDIDDIYEAIHAAGSQKDLTNKVLLQVNMAIFSCAMRGWVPMFVQPSASSWAAPTARLLNDIEQMAFAHRGFGQVNDQFAKASERFYPTFTVTRKTAQWKNEQKRYRK